MLKKKILQIHLRTVLMLAFDPDAFVCFDARSALVSMLPFDNHLATDCVLNQSINQINFDIISELPRKKN